MKSELEYLKLALDEWCKTNGSAKHLPITSASAREVLVIADRLRAADAAKLEQPSV